MVGSSLGLVITFSWTGDIDGSAEVLALGDDSVRMG